MKPIKRTVHKPTTTGSNFIIVNDRDFGDILFGCPPEVIKYFNSERISLPPIIVIPQRTFQRGKNYFDLEFVVYSIFFTEQSRKNITIVCSESQEERIRIVLKESLFGPLLKDIFNTFLFESFDKLKNSNRRRNSLESIVEQVGGNHEIFSKFKNIMSLRLEDQKTHLKMKPVLEKTLGNIPWIKKEPRNRSLNIITKAYVKAAMLKLEMDAFSVCEENENDKLIDNIIRFKHFSSDGKVTLIGKNNTKLKISQTKSGTFKIYRNWKLMDVFDIQMKDKKIYQIAPFPLEIPEFGVTFLGSGTGFDPETFTNCFIIWINGKGIAVDLLADCEDHFRNLGIASSDITQVFLSHLHADHDAGILEKMLIGEKIHLLSSKLIFDCFLRKAEAVTKFTKNNIKDFVYFTNLDVGKEVRIPGIDRAYITFDYGFHSIPSGRFKLRYKSLSGKEITIGVSGDTKYDVNFVNTLYKDGIINARRKDEILGFLWDCDFIIHEAGGGNLHTEAKALASLPSNIKKKCILTHTNQKARNYRGFRFAREGETISLIKQEYNPSIRDFIPLIRKTGLFYRFTSRQFNDLLKHSTIETFHEGEYVFKQGTIGHKFYIILSGFAEVIKDKKVLSIYEKGSFFGELALINKDKKRKATIRAKSKLELLVMDRNLYKKFHLSTIIKERMYELTNYFSDSTNSSIIGYLSRGEFLLYMKGEKIISFGDKSKEVYILLSGEVDVIDAEKRLIAHVPDVEVLGEIAFLKQIPRPATVMVTSKQATTIRLSSKLFTEIIKKFPFFYATILKKMDRRWEVFEKSALKES